MYDKEAEGAIWGMDTFIQVGRRREGGDRGKERQVPYTQVFFSYVEHRFKLIYVGGLETREGDLETAL